MKENLSLKNIYIKARVNLPEYIIIKRKMQLLKIEKISDYIRQATIFGTLFSFQDFYDLTNEWIKFSTQIHKIGTNINQIAHRVNASPENLELYSDDLIFIRNKIQEIKDAQEKLIKKVFTSFKIK